MSLTRFRFTEASTGAIEFDILDRNGAGVPAASLSGATLTLYDLDTCDPNASPAIGVLNHRLDQDVLNVNDVTISSAGHVVWSVTPDDNVVVTERRQIERHRAMFVFTWSGGGFQFECELDVVNLRLAH